MRERNQEGEVFRCIKTEPKGRTHREGIFKKFLSARNSGFGGGASPREKVFQGAWETTKAAAKERKPGPLVKKVTPFPSSIGRGGLKLVLILKR